MHQPMKLRLVLATAALLALAACERPSDASYYNRGGPEALLDVSSEVVNLSVAGPSQLNDLSAWIEKDHPTRAELYCNGPACSEAQKLLDLEAVPSTQIASPDNSVALVYERILARDCNSRFVDPGHNEYNAPHPSFGCSISANIVQQVSDKQEFVSPNLSDDPSARGAVHAYQRAYAPKTQEAKPYSVDQSVVSSAKTQ